jgi:hypothetical protein
MLAGNRVQPNQGMARAIPAGERAMCGRGAFRWDRALLCLTLAGAAIWCLYCHDARADGMEANQAIIKLLDVGWSPSAQARAAADAQTQLTLQAAGRDRRALAAAWLVLMQQRRFDDALKRVVEHLGADPDDLLALRAQTWLHTILKNYAAAMVSADELSLALADLPLETEQQRAEHEETVGFLGRLLGFLGGPAAESVTQDERKTLERKLLARLDASRQAQFEEARNDVLSRYIELTGESADSRERAVAVAQLEREKTLAELQAERAQLEKQAQAIEERREKIQDELRSELDQIATKDQPLVRDLSQLEARATLLSADLVSYSTQIARWQQLAAAERDAARRQQYLFEVESLLLITRRIDADLYAVNRQARGLQQQRAALAARQAQARSAAANQVQRLERELGDLAKRDRRNDGIEKRAARPAAATTSKSRSLAAQASALSTYDAFPLEATKARLLESLR